MEPMTAMMLGSTALSGIGGIVGGLTGSSANRKAQGMASVAGGQGNAMQLNALRQAQEQMAPYTQAGQYAMPLLTYLQTGQNPYSWDDNLQSEYNDLAGQKNALETGYNIYMGSGSSNYRKVKRNTSYATEIAAKLARFRELEAQKRGYDAISGYNMQETPAYQWQQQQGEKSINRALAARGMYNSRPAVNALSDFNMGLNAQETDKQIGRLSQLANFGMGSAANVGNMTVNTGANMAGQAANTGQNIAGMMMQDGQQRGSMWSNALSAPLAAYQNQQYVNALSNR